MQFLQEIEAEGSIINLITHAYGNYVVQTALSVSPKYVREELLRLIMIDINKVKEKNLKEKWERILYDAWEGKFFKVTKNTQAAAIIPTIECKKKQKDYYSVQMSYNDENHR